MPTEVIIDPSLEMLRGTSNLVVTMQTNLSGSKPKVFLEPELSWSHLGGKVLWGTWFDWWMYCCIFILCG